MIDQQRFGQVVLARREELGLSQRDAWKAGGPSGPVWTEIENASGPVPQQRTLAKLDKALQWTAGSARRVLNGGYPTRAVDDHEPELPDMRQEAEIQRSILDTAKTKFQLGVPLTPVEKRALQIDLEDRELDTFHERFELLSHDSQVIVSQKVDELLDEEAQNWVDRFGLPPNEGDEHEEAQQESIESPRGATSGGTRRSGAPNTRAAESAAYDPSQYAGTSGTGPKVPLTQSDVDLAQSKKRDRDLQDERDDHDDAAMHRTGRSVRPERGYRTRRKDRNRAKIDTTNPLR